MLAGVPPLDQQLRDGRAVRRSGLAKVGGLAVEMPELELPGDVEIEVEMAEPAPAPVEPEPEPAAAPEPEPGPAPEPDDLPPAGWLTLQQLAEATNRTEASAAHGAQQKRLVVAV